MTTFAELKPDLDEAIRDGDEERAAEIAERAMAAGISPTELFNGSIVPVLEEVGDKFGRLEIFLPEMMAAGDAVKAVFRVLEPVIKERHESTAQTSGKIIIGTMTGDVHDIGKNMVASLLEVNGFEVLNLGTDVPVKRFMDTAFKEKADIIAMSSLLTTSLPYMKDLLAMVQEIEPADRFKVMVGGGPVTEEWAAQVGADGYGKDASQAVAVARRLMVAQ